MITCSSIGYNGRLANQMFQFASSVGIARKLGYDVKFPVENFTKTDPHDYNGGKLRECFDIPDSYFAPSSLISSAIQYNYSENTFNFNNEALSLPDNVNLHGYFQNENYFKDFSEEIISCFSFRKEIMEKGSISIDDDSVSVHVRRGDYLKFLDHHPVLDRDYYIEAIRKIGSKNVYIFSDDIGWCKENINIDGFVLNFIEEPDPYVSLYLMSSCSNNIISNSSYSWWAAWLNKKEDKKIIGPRVWFGPSMQKDTSGVLPESWIKM
jgi:hypothetical protein